MHHFFVSPLVNLPQNILYWLFMAQDLRLTWLPSPNPTQTNMRMQLQHRADPFWERDAMIYLYVVINCRTHLRSLVEFRDPLSHIKHYWRKGDISYFVACTARAAASYWGFCSVLSLTPFNPLQSPPNQTRPQGSGSFSFRGIPRWLSSSTMSSSFTSSQDVLLWQLEA